MLVIEMQSKFYKKATTKVKFICENGNEISNAIDKAINNDSAEVIITNSKGFDMNGVCVAEFSITWSFKAKK